MLLEKALVLVLISACERQYGSTVCQLAFETWIYNFTHLKLLTVLIDFLKRLKRWLLIMGLFNSFLSAFGRS